MTTRYLSRAEALTYLGMKDDRLRYLVDKLELRSRLDQINGKMVYTEAQLDLIKAIHEKTVGKPVGDWNVFISQVGVQFARLERASPEAEEARRNDPSLQRAIDALEALSEGSFTAPAAWEPDTDKPGSGSGKPAVAATPLPPHLQRQVEVTIRLRPGLPPLVVHIPEQGLPGLLDFLAQE